MHIISRSGVVRLVALAVTLATLSSCARSSGEGIQLSFEDGGTHRYSLTVSSEISVVDPSGRRESFERDRTTGMVEMAVVDVSRGGREATIQTRTTIEGSLAGRDLAPGLQTGRPITYVMNQQGRLVDPGDMRDVIMEIISDSLSELDVQAPVDRDVMVAQLMPMVEEMMTTPWGGSFRYFRDEAVQQGSTWTVDHETNMERSTTRWVVARDTSQFRRLEFAGTGTYQMGMNLTGDPPTIAQVEYSGFFDIDAETAWPIRARTVQELYTVENSGFRIETRNTTDIELVRR
mgnify:CR=1 FL=1